MRYLFFGLVALSMTVSGCKSKKEQIIELNNKLTIINDSLYNRGINLGMIIRASSTTKDFPAIAVYGKQMENFIDEKIIEVNKLENVGGSDQYKDAIAKFLVFEKKLMQDALAPFGKLDKNSSQQQVNDAMQHLINVAKDEQKYLVDVRATQRDFAAKNNITLINTRRSSY